MKFNGQNVIADSDIVMTGLQTGHNLSEVLNQHDKDISNLKSNVKWIYKYGGVGSGAGGGGGSASNTPWNFRVELDDVVREKNTKVNLGQQREYKLTILFFKVLGRSFEIKCTYDTPDGIALFTRLISPTQSPTLTEIINLQVNGTLSISINDDEGNYDLFIMDYIVTAYSFALDYVYDNEDLNVFYPDNNNIFVSAVNEKGGLKARLTQIISVDAKEYYIEYLDWNGVVHELHPDVGDKYCYLDLGKPIANENSGNYSFSVTPHLILSGNNSEEEIQTYKLSDNLIPDTIYLKITTNGTLYETDTVSKPNQFYAGSITFFLTGFQGFPDKTSNYSFKLWLNDEEYIDLDLPTDLQDLTEYEMAIGVGEIGWNKLTFLIKRKDATYTKTYYINTKSALGSFNWYPDQTIDGETRLILPIKSYLYNYINRKTHSNALSIPNLSHTSLIQRVAYSKEVNYAIRDLENQSKNDCLMCVGIKFSKLSDLTKPIMAFKGSNSTYNIVIYQNKIDTMGSTYAPFYIPMDENFHLLSIYKRAVGLKSNSEIFEYIFYLDGVIELVLPEFQSLAETYNTITLLEGCLYDINYLEISYFEHTLQPEGEDTYEVFNPNPNKIRINHLLDSHILYHYYSYRLSLLPDSIPLDFLTAYSYVALFYNNTKTGNIEVNSNMITLLATNVDVPVLRITYVENKSSDSSVIPGNEIMSWIKESYDIKKEAIKAIIAKGKTVSVAYSPGKLDLKEIDLSRFPNASFKLYLQGTSTLLYTGKNFDLAIEGASDDTYTYLYTPNYREGNHETFLPEKRFTLKADIVDSSHSNNNAIGKFINTIATKFHDGQQSTSKYNAHLKNTLEGFPVLLFLENAYFATATSQSTTSDYYFLGIYNFNLGRESEYNLGFKDLRLLPENISSGFQVLLIDNDLVVNEGTANEETISTNSYVPGLGVMEINENKNYFDFSLSDSTILFQLPNSETDNDYMFSKFKANNEDILKSSIIDLVSKVSLAGGYLFEDYLGKNLLSTKEPSHTYGYGYDEGYKTAIPKNMVPNYRVLFTRTFVDSASVLTPRLQPNSTELALKKKGEPNDLINLLIGNPDDGITPILDYLSLSEYYVICMALGLLDSVLKNMNFRRWKDKFYLAFYDMDTALGKDNAGNNSEYLCFSDYWRPDSAVQGGSTVLKPAISYKDWYDINVEGGYDIPSSYLFAVAKYGHCAMEKGDDELKDWYPPNVWARFRRANTLYGWDTAPTGMNNAHIGCLSSANAFIDNYYGKHLEKVPDVVFNLNYRAKYLMLDKNGAALYSYDDRKKFSGRRIHYVKDWLTARFHLLDLYFNIAGVADTIYKYNLDTETWELKGVNLDYKTPDTLFVDNENEDILVKLDAFASGNKDIKYSRNLDLVFTSDTHSPLSLSGAVTGRYLTESNTTNYKLFVETNGKSLSLGGSKAWLTISSINTLIQGGTFYAASTKLTSLTGTEGTCNAWTLNLPALKTLTLNSPLYSGKLTFTGLNNWPNLTSINIRGTKLGLNLDGIKVTTVDASGISGADELTIANCNSLTSLNLTDSVFNKINIVTKLLISYYSTYTYTLKNGVWEKTSTLAGSPKCETLSLKCTANNGIIFITDLVFKDSASGLKEVTLEGFKEVYIDNCPYLSKVTIKDKDNLEKIEITNSASSSSSLSVGSLELNTVNLADCTKLTHINFKSCKKFHYVYLPDNINLPKSSFYYTNIKYLSGNNLKLNAQVFLDCGSFTLLQNDKTTLCSFDNTQKPTDLQYLFSLNAIDLTTFTAFNNQYRNLLENVTNALSMWWNTPATKYTAEMLLEDYKNGKCRFDLSMYKKVSNAKGMLGGLQGADSACHPDTLKGLGANAASIDLSNFYGWGERAGKEVTVPLDWLKHVNTKVTACNCSKDSVIYKVVTYNSSKLELALKTTFNPKDFFGGNSNNKLTSIENWTFASEHTVDLKDSFNTTNFPNLTKITKSFVNCKGANLEFVLGDISKGFLFGNTKLTEISGSFGFTNAANLTVSLDTYLDWENLPINYKGFEYIINWDEKYNVMAFKKTLSSVDNFNGIMNILLQRYGGSYLAGVFRNCTILNGNSPISFNPDLVNTKITQIPYLFSKLKAQTSLTNSTLVNLQWDWNCMQNFPSVTKLSHTFEGIQFLGYIPFNFFKRRQETTEAVYIKNDLGEFENATLYKYSYNTNRISDLSYCFAECTFSVPSFAESSFSELNASRLVKDGTILETKEYYTSNSMFAPKLTVNNPEFDDLNKVIAHADSLSTFFLLTRKTAATEEVTVYNNWSYDSIDGRINFPIISPDFFYACTTGPNLEHCFASTNLLGYIPDNLFINCDSSSLKLSNFLKDALVFPKQYGKRYASNGVLLLDIYYYIGSNFCNATSLDNAFNFKIHLPGTIVLLEDLVLENQLHVFCFVDSFSPLLASMKTAMPLNIQLPAEGDRFMLYHLNNNIYLNTMYDKSGEEEWTDETTGERKQTLGKLGFNLVLYSNLNADHLINYIFSLFMYGNAFDQDTTLQSIKRSSRSNWVFLFGGPNLDLGVSANGIWPSTAAAVSNIIQSTSVSYTQDGGKFENVAGPLRIYKKNINMYIENVTNEHYNKSRANANTGAWGLTFI